jgi:hypothetical protein
MPVRYPASVTKRGDTCGPLAGAAPPGNPPYGVLKGTTIMIAYIILNVLEAHPWLTLLLLAVVLHLPTHIERRRDEDGHVSGVYQSAMYRYEHRPGHARLDYNGLRRLQCAILRRRRPTTDHRPPEGESGRVGEGENWQSPTLRLRGSRACRGAGQVSNLQSPPTERL